MSAIRAGDADRARIAMSKHLDGVAAFAGIHRLPARSDDAPEPRRSATKTA